jgi:hypothetical protein
LPFTLLHPTGLAIEGLFNKGTRIDGLLPTLGGSDGEVIGSDAFLATVLNDLPLKESISF